MDTQQIELVGRKQLELELLRQGFEVARPDRDRGVDLIVYRDRAKRFSAVPVQVKVSSGTGFGVSRKFGRTPGLHVIYVWNAQTDRPRYFILPAREALALIPKTSKDGRWRWPHAPKALLKKLEQHEDRWERLRG